MPLQLQKADLAISAGFIRQFPHDTLPQIAFSGRSNVGKSSLINTLLGRKALARVSGSPGKTITVNFYCIDRQLYFVDLPGYGFAKRSAEDTARWSELTDGYFTQNDRIGNLSLVLQLVDMKVGLTKDDRLMIHFMNSQNIPYAVIATKSDKLNTTERNAAMERLENDPDIPESVQIVPFSSLKHEGTAAVWKLIYEKTNLR